MKSDLSHYREACNQQAITVPDINADKFEALEQLFLNSNFFVLFVFSGFKYHFCVCFWIAIKPFKF